MTPRERRAATALAEKETAAYLSAQLYAEEHARQAAEAERLCAEYGHMPMVCGVCPGCGEPHSPELTVTDILAEDDPALLRELAGHIRVHADLAAAEGAMGDAVRWWGDAAILEDRADASDSARPADDLLLAAGCAPAAAGQDAAC